MADFEKLVDAFGAAASDHGYARAMVRAGFDRPSVWLLAKGDNLQARVKARAALLAHVARMEERAGEAERERGDVRAMLASAMQDHAAYAAALEHGRRIAGERAAVYKATAEMNAADSGVARAERDAALARAGKAEGIARMLLDGVCPECGETMDLCVTEAERFGAYQCACGYTKTADAIRAALDAP